LFSGIFYDWKKHYDRIALIFSVISNRFGQWLPNDWK